MRDNAHLFVWIYSDHVRWCNSMGATGSDPAITQRGVDQIIRNLRERFDLTEAQIEIRDER